MHYYIIHIGGVDFISGPYNIVIPAGQTRVVFNVMINDDNVHEEIETFELIIATGQDLPGGIHLGENLSTTISIEDNDGTYMTNFNNIILLCKMCNCIHSSYSEF